MDRKEGNFHPWQWPGLWSVNLPLLAVLWQALWTRLFFLPAGFYQLSMTAAAVWLFVSAERMLAAGALPGNGTAPWREWSPEARSWLRIWLLTAVSLALVLLVRAGWREAGAMWILLSVSGFYLVAKWHFPTAVNLWLPIEGILPVLLTVAIVLPLLPQVPLLPEPFLPIAMLTGLLFGYHLFLVAAWSRREQPKDSAGGEALGDTVFRGFAPMVILGGSLILLLLLRGRLDVLLIAMAAGAVLLAALDYWSRALSPAQSRLLADLALLSPLVPLTVGAV